MERDVLESLGKKADAERITEIVGLLGEALEEIDTVTAARMHLGSAEQ